MSTRPWVLVALAAAVLAGTPGNAEARRRPPLLVADVGKVSDDERLMFAALEGLVNRRKPRVYLVGQRNGQNFIGDPTAEMWLRDTVRLRAKRVAPYRLLRKFRRKVRGLVVWDPALKVDTQNVATTIAGQKRLLPVSPELATRLRRRFRVRLDLRGEHLETRQQAYDWALAHYGPPARFRMLAWLGGPRNGRTGQHGLRDFIVAKRGFAFEGEPHREGDFVTRLLDSFPRGTPVYGYPFFDDPFYNRSGYAAGEPFGVGEISRSGKYLIPSADATNLTVHDRFKRRPAQRPPWDDRRRTPNPAKTYVAFLLSDGDNIGYNEHSLRIDHWDKPTHGAVPMGVSISPWLAVYMPRIYRWYVRSMKPNDVLIAGPSGAGYIYPQLHPELDRFLAKSRRVMDLAGLRAVWVLDNGYLASPSPEVTAEYARVLRPSAIFADYGGYALPNPPAVSFSGDTPVVHALWGTKVGQTVQQVRLAAASYPGRPSFVAAAIPPWSMGYPQAAAVMRQLGPGYEAVRPDRFIGLLRGARAGAASSSRAAAQRGARAPR